MKLYLKNIGVIEEADVKLDGLTLIAGENDTGKSTVLKTLFSIVKADNISKTSKFNEQRSKEILAIRFNLVFDANVSKEGKIKFFNSSNDIIIDIEIKDNNYVKKFYRKPDAKERFFDATFIPSPLIFDFIDFFNSVARMKEKKKFDFGLDFDIKYPYIMWDLYDKLISSNRYTRVKRQNISFIIEDIINGKFVVEKNTNEVHYYKSINNKIKPISMFNTAMGIKSFGIMQLLNENGYLHPKYVLLLDEPEVHLHPEWQLKMAKLIVILVKKGIKIVVTSHSPYMIEALKKYSELENLKNVNFYLAENNKIFQVENSNALTLEKIFQKLSAPFDEFDRIDEKLMDENG